MTPRLSGKERALRIIAEVYETGPVDVGGGVPAHYIAEEMDLAEGNIHSYLDPLVDEGDLERVWGIGHDTNCPRRSYVPAGESDE